MSQGQRKKFKIEIKVFLFIKWIERRKGSAKRKRKNRFYTLTDIANVENKFAKRVRRASKNIQKRKYSVIRPVMLKIEALLTLNDHKKYDDTIISFSFILTFL